MELFLPPKYLRMLPMNHAEEWPLGLVVPILSLLAPSRLPHAAVAFIPVPTPRTIRRAPSQSARTTRLARDSRARKDGDASSFLDDIDERRRGWGGRGIVLPRGRRWARRRPDILVRNVVRFDDGNDDRDLGVHGECGDRRRRRRGRRYAASVEKTIDHAGGSVQRAQDLVRPVHVVGRRHYCSPHCADASTLRKYSRSYRTISYFPRTHSRYRTL
jgi:hypothetical protein